MKRGIKEALLTIGCFASGMAAAAMFVPHAEDMSDQIFFTFVLGVFIGTVLLAILAGALTWGERLRWYTATKCKHRTRRTGEVHAFECCVTTTMSRNESGSVDYCLDCIGKMAIRCAWCQGPIFIGDPVTLYTPSGPDYEVPPHAVVHSRDPLQLVGCLRVGCADTGADRAGFWIPGSNGGCVERVETPYEMTLGDLSGPGVTMIVSDPTKEPTRLA